MIDVKVSNEKLYWRAVGILQKFSNKSANECEQSLLTAIYGSRARAGDTSITLHIENATDQSLVVPKALIMLITGCDHVEASRMLNESQNSVRGCIRKLKSSHQKTKMLTLGLRLIRDINFNLYLRVSVCKIQYGAIYEIQSSKMYFIKWNEILIRIDRKIVKSNLGAIFC